MVLISVIIPVYNVEKYIEDSLNSVLNQSFKDIEVICVDDESTDNSLRILNEFEARDKRVKVISQKNKGNGGARNTGLKHASGDYVYFLDADDLLFENALEKMYRNAKSNQSDLVIFKITRFYETEDLIYDKPSFPLDEILKNDNYDDFTFNYKEIKPYVMNKGSFGIWAKLYKKEFLDEHGDIFVFPEKTPFGDVRFHVASLILAPRISFIDDYLYKYRLSNPDSITNSRSNRIKIFDVIDSVEDLLIDTGFHEEFKDEFAKFKIYQILHHMSSANSVEYFNKAREEFLKIDADNLNLPVSYKGRYQLLLDSDNYNNYLHELILYGNGRNNKYHIITKTNESEKLKKENKILKKELKELKEAKKDKFGFLKFTKSQRIKSSALKSYYSF